MSLDKATVARIAQLARIRLPEAALEPLAKELSAILTWIEQLNEVNVESVEPMTSVVEMALRHPGLSRSHGTSIVLRPQMIAASPSPIIRKTGAKRATGASGAKTAAHAAGNAPACTATINAQNDRWAK